MSCQYFLIGIYSQYWNFGTASIFGKEGVGYRLELPLYKILGASHKILAHEHIGRCALQVLETAEEWATVWRYL